MRRTWLSFACVASGLAAFFGWLAGVAAVPFILAGIFISWLLTTYKIIPDMYKSTVTGDAKNPIGAFAGFGGKLLLVAMFLFPAIARQFGPAVYYGYASGVCAGGGTQFFLMLRSRLLSNFPNPPVKGDPDGSDPARHLRRALKRKHR